MNRSIYYMRDNHTFAQLPLDVETAMLKLHEVFDGYCGHYGMLATKDGPMAHKVVHSGREWEPFAKEARPWLEAALGPTAADIEYSSWITP